MRKIMAVLSFAFLLMGCSVAYRSGQTPDDVYFSPARNNNAGYVALDDEDGNGRYNASAVPMQDRYLRMKTFGGSRWNTFDDDYSYWNNPLWNNRSYFDLFSYGGNIGFNNLSLGNLSLGNPFLFNPISYYYSPFSPMYYGQPVVTLNTFKTTVAPKNSGPRVYNLSSYNPPRASYSDPKFGNMKATGTYYNNTNNSYYRGNDYNSGGSSRIFNNNSSGGNYAPSGSSSSGSSGTAPVRTFPRGGN